MNECSNCGVSDNWSEWEGWTLITPGPLPTTLTACSFLCLIAAAANAAQR